MSPPAFVVKENNMGGKKSNCENHIKWGPKRCKMMGGFQIWLQNQNRITFDPFFAQKTVQRRLNRVFRQFSTVFWSKRDQILFDLNFEARF